MQLHVLARKVRSISQREASRGSMNVAHSLWMVIPRCVCSSPAFAGEVPGD
jgi:hypothetical protein